MSDTVNSSRSKAVLAVVLATAAIVGAGLYFYFRKPVEPDPISRFQNITATQAAHYIRQAELANAHLENESFRDGYEAAEKIYRELQQSIPEDSFALHNLVVLNILRYKSIEEELAANESEHEAYLERTYQLVQSLLEKEEESFIPYLLAFRFRYAISKNIEEQDIDFLNQACDRAGDSVIPFAEFYLATSYLREKDLPGITKKRNDRLAEAYHRQKDNIKLTGEYLGVLAKSRSAQFADVWKEFKKTFVPVLNGLDLEDRRSQRGENISRIDAALASNNWDEIMTSWNRLWNITKSKAIQKIDLGRIKIHELELMRLELDPAIVKKVKKESGNTTEVVPVQFKSYPIVIDPRKAIAVRTTDFDLDSHLEIVVLYPNSLEVYQRQNIPDLASWKRINKIELKGQYNDILVGDLDYDNQGKVTAKKNSQDETSQTSGTEHWLFGDPDFVLTGESGILVIENRMNPDGSRTLIETRNKEFAGIGPISASVVVDIDHDRDLDLLFATKGKIRLFLARGDLSYFDFSRGIGFPESGETITQLDIVDLDRDIDIDVLIGFENRAPAYLENLNHSTLRFREMDASFTGLNECRFIRAVEVDGIPSWDIVSTGPSSFQLRTSRTSSGGIQLRESQSFEQGGNGLVVGDFNNDGFVDCIQTHGNQPASMLLGNGTGFQDPVLTEFKIATAEEDDLDLDGMIDLVAVSQGQVVLLQNQSSNENGWCEFQICGITSNFEKGRVNNHSIGSLVESKIEGRYGATTAAKPRIHFGLGKADKADLVRILWTSGMPQSHLDVKSGQVIYEEMFEKGSCPYMYTWNGTRYEYFGDCLWAAPLGLQSARGQFIPCRNWEYLKIPGTQLKPIKGEYRLQLTEELREATYFDQVELFAIDHPKGFDIFTNDKVGPPFIAQHKILTVSDRVYPKAATDRFGNDVLGKIIKRDEEYFRGFRKPIAKGLVPMHYIELDLGKLESTDDLTLYLHGWIRPTDSSLNISFSQNPKIDGPVPPVILVPDENGNWKKTIDPMGFPGGKSKTIAVDLSKAFLTDDYRLRIQTSHEIYWDEIFFSQEKPVDVIQTKLSLHSADLHYRGFSKRFIPGPDAPEWYDYSQVTTAPRWPPMAGNFTRYGEVAELLHHADDCSAVLGAGDEMTVCFGAIPDPPPGWKRDFVIHLIGYDKDGDLNTATGQSAEPLPFDAMKSYPYSSDFPASQKILDYLKKYQTRKQTGRFWKDLQPVD